MLSEREHDLLEALRPLARCGEATYHEGCDPDGPGMCVGFVGAVSVAELLRARKVFRRIAKAEGLSLDALDTEALA